MSSEVPTDVPAPDDSPRRPVLQPLVEGADRVPAEGPVLVALNDPWRGALSWARRGLLPRPARLVRVGPAAASRRLTVPGRSTRLAPEEDKVSALDRLAAGELVIIQPEGGSSPDGRLYQGYPDLGWLAVSARVAVIPAAILPQAGNASLPRALQVLRTPVLRLGEPLDFTRYWTTPALNEVLDGVLLRAVTDEVMAAIQQLSGQVYCDSYRVDEVARRRAARSAAGSWRIRLDQPRIEQARQRARLAADLDEDLALAAAQTGTPLPPDRQRQRHALGPPASQEHPGGAAR